MRGYTPEQRQRIAEIISDLAREWIVQRESEFEFDLQRGVEWCTDVRSGDRTPRANQTLTLTLRVNGGAQESEGPPIVPTPTVFRGPEA